MMALIGHAAALFVARGTMMKRAHAFSIRPNPTDGPMANAMMEMVAGE